jgi:hypothetical protein
MLDPMRLREFVYEIDGVVYWKIDVGCRGRRDTIAGCIHIVKGELRWTIQIRRRKYLRSRVIFALHNRRWVVEGMVIDHIDGDTCNDRIENLREVTQAQNMENRRRPWGFMPGSSYWDTI